MRRSLGVVCLIAVMIAPGAAHAIERQFLIGGSLSFAHEFADGGRPGGGGGVYGRYFISDYIALGGDLAWSGLSSPAGDQGRRLRQVMTAVVSLYYMADYIRLVPFVGVGMGAAVSVQDGADASYLAQASLGGFVIATPALTVALEAAYQLLVGEDVLPARVVISVQVGWRHIFF